MSEITIEAIETLRDDLFDAHARDPEAACPPWVVRRFGEVAGRDPAPMSLADAAFVTAELAAAEERAPLDSLVLARRLLGVMHPSAPCPDLIRIEVQARLGAFPAPRRVAGLPDDATVLEVLVLAGQLLSTPRLTTPAAHVPQISHGPFEF